MPKQNSLFTPIVARRRVNIHFYCVFHHALPSIQKDKYKNKIKVASLKKYFPVQFKSIKNALFQYFLSQMD